MLNPQCLLCLVKPAFEQNTNSNCTTRDLKEMSKIGRFGIFSDVKFRSQLKLKDCTFESVNYAEIQVNEAKVEHTHKLEDSSHEYFTSHQLCQLLNLAARAAKGLLDDHKTIVFFSCF